MNSNMNQNSNFDSDQFLNWLLLSGFDYSDPEPISLTEDIDRVASTEKWEDEEIYLLNQEENDFSLTNFPHLWSNSHSRQTMSDLNIVETRFQDLLKQRLQTEMANRPPLFPWENEVYDYDSDFQENVQESWLLSLQAWFPQLQQLSLPMALSDQILTEIMEGCLQGIKTGQAQGIKLVNAIQGLFPEQNQALNQIANMVLLANTRDGNSQTKIKVEGSYDQINLQQQMAVSMLAAQEIFNALTLSLSSQEKIVTKQWQTTSGLMTLEAVYESDQSQDTPHNSVKIKVYLPRGGSLSCETLETSASTERAYPGFLSIELFDCQIGKTYPLTVGFPEPDEIPLTFALVINR